MTLVEQLLTSCPRCPEWQVPCFTAEEKQATEQRHSDRHHPTVEAVTDLITSDPTHAADVAEVIAAIELDAKVHAGEVDPNRVRDLLPAHVQPNVVGATYNTLIRQGRLEQVGWTTNQDRKGRNVGKPLPTYLLRDGGAE